MVLCSMVRGLAPRSGPLPLAIQLPQVKSIKYCAVDVSALPSTSTKPCHRSNSQRGGDCRVCVVVQRSSTTFDAVC